MTSGPDNASSRGPLAVAYLTNAYPALSQPFIEREVLALRDLGVRVETFTMRATDDDSVLSARSQREAAETVAVLGRPLGHYVRAHVRLLVRRPRAWAAGFLQAMRWGPAGLKAKLWQFFYFTEAVAFLELLVARGLRHVHVHHAFSAADVARLAVRMGSWVDGTTRWSWSVSLHGPREFFEPSRFDLAAKLADAAVVACISDYCLQMAKDLMEPADHNKLAMVRMSVPTDQYVGTALERHKRTASDVRVLFVGRLVPEKGPDVLLDAVAQATSRVASLRLSVAIIGKGPMEDALKQRVEEAGLDQVTLVGPQSQDQLPEWYAWADIFCLPSYAEGVPVVLMEAMASELPVVSTKIAGIPELVSDGQSGLLVEPGDAQEVAAALVDLSGSADMRYSMGVNGRQRVVETYSAEVNARILAAAFSRIGTGPSVH